MSLWDDAENLRNDADIELDEAVGVLKQSVEDMETKYQRLTCDLENLAEKISNVDDKVGEVVDLLDEIDAYGDRELISTKIDAAISELNRIRTLIYA